MFILFNSPFGFWFSLPSYLLPGAFSRLKDHLLWGHSHFFWIIFLGLNMWFVWAIGGERKSFHCYVGAIYKFHRKDANVNCLIAISWHSAMLVWEIHGECFSIFDRFLRKFDSFYLEYTLNLFYVHHGSLVRAWSNTRGYNQ